MLEEKMDNLSAENNATDGNENQTPDATNLENATEASEQEVSNVVELTSCRRYFSGSK
jgi:hypothetical protein